jgi:hypothetical protein
MRRDHPRARPSLHASTRPNASAQDWRLSVWRNSNPTSPPSVTTSPCPPWLAASGGGGCLLHLPSPRRPPGLANKLMGSGADHPAAIEPVAEFIWPDKLRWQAGGSLGCYYTPVGVPVGDKG